MSIKSKPYGHGRIRFLADLDAIKDELSRGLTLKACYDKRSKKLGIMYSNFTKLVARYAADARPATAQLKLDIFTNERPQRKTNASHGEQTHTGVADPDLIRRLTKGNGGR